MKKGQIVGLDFVRFFAALAVTGHHLGGSTWMIPEQTAIRQMLGSTISLPQFAWMYHGWIGVEVFFVISGVVIAYSAQQANAYKFAVGRIVRMAPALWICATITAIVVWGYGQDNVLRRYLSSMLFLPAGTYIDPSHWTLAIEIVFYGLVFLLITFEMRQKFILAISLVGLLSAGAWFLYALGVVDAPASRTSALLLLQHGIYFSIGALIQNLTKTRFLWRNALFICFLSTAAFFEINYQHDLLQSRLIYADYAASSIVPLMVWFLSLLVIIGSIFYNDKLSKYVGVNIFLRKMGLATYPLYLINAIIGAAFLGLLVRNGLSAPWALIAAIVFCIISSIGIAGYVEPFAKNLLSRFIDKYFGSKLNSMSSHRG